MKKIIVTILSICIAIRLFAQHVEPAIAKARYTFSHITDTTNRDKPYVEEMLLIIGKNSSLYISNVKLTQLINFKKHLAEQIKNNGGSLNGATITTARKQRAIQTEQYSFNKENKFITVEKLIQDYLIEEEIPKIDWKISKDTMNFAGLKCQKAIAKFKGRNWTAWFAPALPFQSGPWKLNGLPGLIVEAYDEKNEVLFKFGGFEAVQAVGSTEKKYTNEDEKFLDTELMGNEIRLSPKAIKVSQQELARLKDTMKNDPYGFAKAQLAGSSMAGFAEMVKKSPENKQNPIIDSFNNPIELN